eukprot:COSAG01_NODE_23321_length_821_cov_3.022222_1_plen_87_part_10
MLADVEATALQRGRGLLPPGASGSRNDIRTGSAPLRASGNGNGNEAFPPRLHAWLTTRMPPPMPPHAPPSPCPTAGAGTEAPGGWDG